MSRGIIKSTPRPTKPKGVVILTETDQNWWNLGKGVHSGIGNDPELNLNVGDIVACTITSQWTCDVTGWVEPGRLAKGEVLELPANGLQGRLSLTAEGYPNPYDVASGAELRYDEPGFSLQPGDIVTCLPISAGACDIIQKV